MFGLFFIIFFIISYCRTFHEPLRRCEHAVCDRVLKHFIQDRREDYTKMLFPFILLLSCIDLMIKTKKK